MASSSTRSASPARTPSTKCEAKSGFSGSRFTPSGLRLAAAQAFASRCFCSSMKSSTRSRRSRAAAGWRKGESALGARIIAAKQRALGGREILHVLPEVEARGARHAVDRVGAVLAQVDLVQVGLEDLALRVAGLEPEGARDLGELAAQRALGGEVDVLRELLGDRAAALGDAALLRVLDQRADAADRVDADVRVEAAVLGVEHGVDHVRGHALEAHDLAVLAALGEGGEERRLEQHARRGLAVEAERLDVLARVEECVASAPGGGAPG